MDDIAFKNDWRYAGQERYLKNATLKYAHFNSSLRDHDHCEFCYAKFSDKSNDLHDGYCTLDAYHWICPDCYHDFKEIFQWKIEK